MFLLVGVWGSFERKLIAAYKLFFYTLFGSLLLLLFLLSIFSSLSAFDYYEMLLFNFSEENDNFIIFIIFIIAFGIKIPIFPLHTWLPEAHGEASTIGSILLAGVLLKLGGYAIIRFMLTFFSNAFYYFQPFIYFICLLGIFYTSFAAIQQTDIKRIIAYSSITHMSIVVISIFTMNVSSLVGSYYTMIGHGVTSTFLFFIAGCLYSRFSTKSVYYFSNLSTSTPLIAIFYFFSTISNMSFPGTVVFICELTSMFGIFNGSQNIGFISMLTSYMPTVNAIWTLTRVIFSVEKNVSITKFKQFFDLTFIEFYVAFTFWFFLVFFGFFPNFLISGFEAQANYVIADIFEIKQPINNVVNKIYVLRQT